MDQEGERRLVAILSADAVGYSRLMGDDEAATVATLDAYRGVFRNLIESRKGRVVDTAGDSVLAVFPSLVEAVECAVTARNCHEVGFPIAKSARSSADHGLSCQLRAGFAVVGNPG